MNNNVIEIRGLSKSYGPVRGIDSISLTVEQGEIFGFIGPNGAGKSTTIRILLNLIFPTAGTASIMGMDVVRETRRIKMRTGYIPADAVEYPSMRAGEFLRYCGSYYGTADSARRITEMCSFFELDPDRRISDLSRGNRKKVSIIQSLIHYPDLLILDEPTMGLDPLMQEKFFELLRTENNRGMSIFFSSHILSEVQRLCRSVAIIREGKIVQVEDIGTLRKKQLKKISVECAERAAEALLKIKGVESVIVNTETMASFMFSGDISQMINELSQRKVVNLTVEEPSLEEIFMHYYTQTDDTH